MSDNKENKISLDKNKLLGYAIISIIIGIMASLSILRTLSDKYADIALIVVIALIVGFMIGYLTVSRKHITVKEIGYIVITISVIAGTILGSLINGVIEQERRENEIHQEIEDKTTEEKEAYEYTTYDLDHTLLDDEESKEVAKMLNKKLNYIETHNEYFEIQTDETNYSIYLSNKDHELFEQTSDGAITSIYRNDKTSYRYADSVLTKGLDIDVITLLHNGLKALTSGVNGVQMFEMHIDDAESKTLHEYRLDLNGKEAVKSLYISLGDDFADLMLSNTAAQLNGEWQPHMTYSFLVDDKNDTFQIFALLTDTDGIEKSIWAIGSFYEIGIDWKLPKEWYDDKYVAGLDESGSEKLVADTVDIIVNVMNKHEQEIERKNKANEVSNNTVSKNNISENNVIVISGNNFQPYTEFNDNKEEIFNINGTLSKNSISLNGTEDILNRLELDK